MQNILMDALAVGAYAGNSKRLLFEMTPEAVIQIDLVIRICVDVEALDSATGQKVAAGCQTERRRSDMWSAMVMKEIRVHSWIEASWKVIRTV